MSGISAELTTAINSVDTSYLLDKNYCDNCLGRLFAKIGTGIPNWVRGQAVRDITRIARTRPAECQMCAGISSNYDYYADMAMKNLSGWESTNFLIGSKFDAEIIEAEEIMWSQVSGDFSEPIKAEFNREVGKLVHEGTGREVEFEKPEIVLIIDTTYDSLNVQVAPLYIYGRYRKLVRGIPQTRWPCRECKGKGCERCDRTGKMYQTSVEEVIGQAVMVHSGGKDHRFHGMGREDVDALMLGKGRPFILEIKEPVKRGLPLDVIESSVNSDDNGVEVNSLRHSDGAEVVALKNARNDKRYRVTVAFEGEFTEAKLNEVVLSLGGITITQQTPTRVKHRRADKARRRAVKTLDMTELSGSRAVFELTAEAGTYVKEFVHGDNGRTVPSISGELGVACRVEELDVVEIIDSQE